MTKAMLLDIFGQSRPRERENLAPNPVTPYESLNTISPASELLNRAVADHEDGRYCAREAELDCIFSHS